MLQVLLRQGCSLCHTQYSCFNAHLLLLLMLCKLLDPQICSFCMSVQMLSYSIRPCTAGEVQTCTACAGQQSLVMHQLKLA